MYLYNDANHCTTNTKLLARPKHALHAPSYGSILQLYCSSSSGSARPEGRDPWDYTSPFIFHNYACMGVAVVAHMHKAPLHYIRPLSSILHVGLGHSSRIYLRTLSLWKTSCPMATCGHESGQSSPLDSEFEYRQTNWRILHGLVDLTVALKVTQQLCSLNLVFCTWASLVEPSLVEWSLVE